MSFKKIAKASHEPDYSYEILKNRENVNLVLEFEKF